LSLKLEVLESSSLTPKSIGASGVVLRATLKDYVGSGRFVSVRLCDFASQCLLFSFIFVPGVPQKQPPCTSAYVHVRKTCSIP
jgi:hypothetical protein